MENNQLSAVKLVEKIGIASRNIESHIKKLKELGILVRHGSPKNGYWEIVEDKEEVGFVVSYPDLLLFIPFFNELRIPATLWKQQ